jgi:hypothetical protein
MWQGKVSVQEVPRLTIQRQGSRVDGHRGDRMDLSTALVILLVGAALIGWLWGARDGRGLEAFGFGFIGYRSYGWPRGVQEEDSVHFTFATRDPEGARPGRAVDDSNAHVEMIELDGPPDDLEVRRLR